MSWSGTGRFGLREAPGGLGLVQDFVNTKTIGDYGPDLLSSTELAQPWLSRALAAWSAARGLDVPEITLSEGDLAALREVRSLFEQLVHGEEVSAPGPVRTALLPGRDGSVRLAPSGAGGDWLVSALWTETLLAQQAKTWPRLKICRREECGSAFYDVSRNNSGVWHDVKTCGNISNLRASRERKRAAAG
ncbi:CGNR zinc finger domain-containing protein [Amycolatopsis sp. H20-H5]|uniref:CGNR zinc finger domain-containing protein n=1 Tax=Amycolatopsis sp. H20-H5 TaxID=3046309 RepID=UPI002DBBB51D|nr:CGNR zinc finger domain-containing protein [Amycolatopsis sp. H20-H5]MEC3975127.1 CGNR zinc finger domain-containing protein [Amycolatopsis sp. H20-H5]